MRPEVPQAPSRYLLKVLEIIGAYGADQGHKSVVGESYLVFGVLDIEIFSDGF